MNVCECVLCQARQVTGKMEETASQPIYAVGARPGKSVERMPLPLSPAASVCLRAKEHMFRHGIGSDMLSSELSAAVTIL